MAKFSLFKAARKNTNKNVRNFSGTESAQLERDGGIVVGTDDWYVVVSW